MLGRFHAVALAGLALVAASCSRPVDLAAELQVEQVTTGWFDAGVVNSQNKLVPSISFTLRNTSPEELKLQLNVVYKILPEGEDRDDSFLQNIRVPANGSTEPMTIRAQNGFTSEAPRADMLQHSLFRDFEVRLFAKHGSSSWVPLGEYRVERQLLTR